MRYPFAFVAVLLVAALPQLPAASSADWVTAAYDASRSGRTADVASPPYKHVWAKSWDGENVATVSQLIAAQSRGYIGTLGRPPVDDPGLPRRRFFPRAARAAD